MVKHGEGKKVPPGGNLGSQEDFCRLYGGRIENLELKIARLEGKLTGLEFQVKFIADILRKEQSE